MSRRVFYAAFFCFSPELGSRVEAVFEGNKEGEVVAIRIWIKRGDFLPLGLVEEIEKVLRKWEKEFPCKDTS